MHVRGDKALGSGQFQRACNPVRRGGSEQEQKREPQGAQGFTGENTRRIQHCLSPTVKWPGAARWFANGCAALQLLRDDFMLQVLGGLRDIFRRAEIAPVIFIGAEGLDFFSLSGES